MLNVKCLLKCFDESGREFKNQGQNSLIIFSNSLAETLFYEFLIDLTHCVLLSSQINFEAPKSSFQAIIDFLYFPGLIFHHIFKFLKFFIYIYIKYRFITFTFFSGDFRHYGTHYNNSFSSNLQPTNSGISLFTIDGGSLMTNLKSVSRMNGFLSSINGKNPTLLAITFWYIRHNITKVIQSLLSIH